MSCQLCERDLDLTKHHLIPKTYHNNTWFKKRFSKEDMHSRIINICPDCHKFIHGHYKERELGREYNTLEKLQNQEKIIKFVNWVKKR